MPASVYAAISAVGASGYIAERDFSWRVSGERWDYLGLNRTLRDLPPSALAGSIQYRNAATALAALEALEAPKPAARPAGRALAGGVRPPVGAPGRWALPVG